MHLLPVLARLEKRFEDQPLLVIGVHSAKFLSEQNPENIRQAVKRHSVSHPVIVDSERDIWQLFGVRAWPTVVLVDAEGYIRETISGEVEEEVLASKIEQLLREATEKGVLVSTPLQLAPNQEPDDTFLRFPGKIYHSGDRLYIADSGHNRIVIADLEGGVRSIVGEGGVGADDGPSAHASFHNPQGLAIVGDELYVADTGNHLIRSINLGTLEVRTVAGTGKKGTGPANFDPREPLNVPLRSPWALLAVGQQILVSMAGSHQIWAFDPCERIIAPWAGSGLEDHVDGPLNQAAFAQPSGLARAGRYIIVADSEISSVRAIDLQEGTVRTIVGRGLFDFGDRDGTPDQVLLQHPLDVAADTNVVYVADSFNNKIKAISFGTMETRTVLGSGDTSILREPGGITVAQGSVFIVDTNNHRIVQGDPQTGMLEELVLK